MGSYRVRRFVAVIIILIISAYPLSRSSFDLPTLNDILQTPSPTVPVALSELEVKGRAPKTGYARSQFGNGWEDYNGCDTRNLILKRDLVDVLLNEECKVMSGSLQDPYTFETIKFVRGETTSDDVQIDHVVALSNSWQTGAQQLTYADRVRFANDPLNLLAVQGKANEQKSDGDAATWLPPNKSFRCTYVNRQIAVKKKYQLWVTPAERNAMVRVLAGC